MKNIRIANRYSKALFSLSIEVNMLDVVKADMALISQTITESAELKRFLLSPVIKDEKKIKVIKSVFENKINNFTLHFIYLVVHKRRFLFIDFIAEEFLNLYRSFKNIKLARFETASPLGEKMKERITDILKDFTQKDIELYEEIKKDLIGGFILKIDDMQYDTSIKSKLVKLTKEFSVNTYEKGL